MPLSKTIEIPSMTIVVRAVFHKNNKYCPEVLQVYTNYKNLYCDRTDVSEEIDINKTTASKEYNICNY